MLFCFLDVLLLLFIFNKYKVFIILYLLSITNKNKNTRNGVIWVVDLYKWVSDSNTRTCKMIFINHKHLHVADFLKPSLYIDHKMSYIYVYWVNQNQVYVQMHENCSKYCFKEYRVRVFQTYDFLLFIFSRSTGCKRVLGL